MKSIHPKGKDIANDIEEERAVRKCGRNLQRKIKDLKRQSHRADRRILPNLDN